MKGGLRWEKMQMISQRNCVPEEAEAFATDLRVCEEKVAVHDRADW